MIDIFFYITMLAYVHPTACEQAIAFKPVLPFHVHYRWHTDTDSGITPFLSCVPSGAKYNLRVVDI